MNIGTSAKMLHACPEVTQGRGLDGVKAITVPEIYEAVRRHSTDYRRPIGFSRDLAARCATMPYLAF